MSSKKNSMSNEQSRETLKRVLRSIRPYRGGVLLSLALALVTVALTLYVPILTGEAVDQILGPGQVDFFRSGCHSFQNPLGGGGDGPCAVADESYQQPDYLPGV